jgi:hypothetical protein
MKKPILIAYAMTLLSRASIADETDGVAFFESKVRPLLVERCIECHGAEKQKGGLRLDSRAGWQTGGEHGSPVVPGKPEESLLIKAVRYADKDLQIHSKEKGGKLGEAEIAVLIQWVKIGAPDPRSAEAVTAAAPVAEKAKIYQQLYKEFLKRYGESCELKDLMSPFGGRPDLGLGKQSYRDGCPMIIWIFSDRASSCVTGTGSSAKSVAARSGSFIWLTMSGFTPSLSS